MGTEQSAFALDFTTVAVPVAVYFLILGLLNSRAHPQLLTARRDFALLVGALSPLFLLPLFPYVLTFAAGLLVTLVLLAGVCVLVPRRRSWVIYNLLPSQGSLIVEPTLRDMHLRITPRGRVGFDLPEQHATVEVSAFPLLRNVSIRLRGEGDLSTLTKRFERKLGEELASVRTEPSPMAVGLLLVGTAMLVAPLAMVAHRADEIVRILTDLLN